jgi:hypothetical protein
MKKISIFLFSILIFNWGFSQYSNEEIMSRLGALRNDRAEFMNIDNIEIISRTIEGELSSKLIAKEFKEFGVKKRDLVVSDSRFSNQNFAVKKSERNYDGSKIISNYYFLQKTKSKIIGINFNYLDSANQELETKLIQLLLNDGIPASHYASMSIDSINFLGRKIALGPQCRWQGVSNVQCPYYGQMSWSIHHSLADAKKSMTSQKRITSSRPGLKILSDTIQTVIFEGQETLATKVMVGFSGTTSLAVSMSGGKTLTVYYVNTFIRGKYVCCVMSFWNNDRIQPSGLPPLLEKVMTLKNE